MKIPLFFLKIVTRIRDSKILRFIVNINIDWIFVLLLMLLLSINPWWYRILIAIGATYTFKFVVHDLMKLLRLN